MLRGIIIGPDEIMSSKLRDSLSQISALGIVRSIDRYPDTIDLGRTLRAHSPQVVFLGMQDLEAAVETAIQVEAVAPGMPIVAFGSEAESRELRTVMRYGVREYLAAPFQIPEITDSLSRVKQLLDRNPSRPFETEYLYSFLPAKPGVGTSTVSMNAAWACSNLPETKTLLMDFDLNSGMQRFMLKVENAYSIVDAAENASKLDEALWPQLITPLAQMDVIHSGRLNPGYRIEGSQMRSLLGFVRRYYKSVCIDLSGNMEKYSIEIMHESKRVFLVTTSEIASLHQARERFQYLRKLDLGDRVHLILNRYSKRATISVPQIEELLGIPVFITVPNDYQCVSRALTAGKPVEEASALGRVFQNLALSMLDRAPAKPTLKSTRSITEYLSVLPGKSVLFADKRGS